MGFLWCDAGFDANAASNLHIHPLYMIVPLFLSMVIGGGLEEFSWRGVLVYQLRKTNPVFISLGVGLIWAVWHIPPFFLGGVGRYHANVLAFLITIIAYSRVLTPFSLLVAQPSLQIAEIRDVCIFHEEQQNQGCSQ